MYGDLMNSGVLCKEGSEVEDMSEANQQTTLGLDF